MLNGGYENSELWQPVDCAHLDEFHDRLDCLKTIWPAGKFLYRGHRDANSLLRSTWERKFRGDLPQKAGPYEIYRVEDPKRAVFRTHLYRFRSELDRQSAMYAELAEVAAMDDNLLAALGRHHGLFTPLLDWTTKPDVAMYFAFCHEERQGEQAAAIWMLCLQEDFRDDDYFQWGKWLHTSFSMRQKAQSGVFTWLSDEIFSDLANYMVNHHHNAKYPYLSKFMIPWSAVSEVREYLASRQISRKMLFPQTDIFPGLSRVDEIARKCNAQLPNS